ncbi:MAG: hypothetical protein E7214_11205 [Clostridium sp.]|nr:hypothetical protein [Clostridium sp.]
MININFNSSIYIWFSIEYGFLYVGETNNKLGIIGRAYQHVMESGTLYYQVYERIGVDLYNINDLVLCNFPLPNERRYNSRESIYRFAVEYLVQRILIEERKNIKFKFKVISNVKSNDYVENIEVQNIAKCIFEEFNRELNLNNV